MGVPGQTGLSGAEERSESESGVGGAVLEGGVGVVGRTGLSGASERSSSES